MKSSQHKAGRVDMKGSHVDDGGMASRRSTARHFSVPIDTSLGSQLSSESCDQCNGHFSVPEEPSSSSQYECQQQQIWTSDTRDDRTRREASHRRYVDIAATPSELQGLLPPHADEQGSEDYRSNFVAETAIIIIITVQGFDASWY